MVCIETLEEHPRAALPRLAGLVRQGAIRGHAGGQDRGHAKNHVSHVKLLQELGEEKCNPGSAVKGAASITQINRHTGLKFRAGRRFLASCPQEVLLVQRNSRENPVRERVILRLMTRAMAFHGRPRPTAGSLVEVRCSRLRRCRRTEINPCPCRVHPCIFAANV